MINQRCAADREAWHVAGTWALRCVYGWYLYVLPHGCCHTNTDLVEIKSSLNSLRVSSGDQRELQGASHRLSIAYIKARTRPAKRTEKDVHARRLQHQSLSSRVHAQGNAVAKLCSTKTPEPCSAHVRTPPNHLSLPRRRREDAAHPPAVHYRFPR